MAGATNSLWTHVIWVLAVVFSVGLARASEPILKERQKMIGLGYLSALTEDRDIKTVNADLAFAIAGPGHLPLWTYFDVVGTYATGDITQLEGELREGTLRKVEYNTGAFGIGPGLRLDLELMEIEGLHVDLCGSGHLVLYSQRFPAGGDHYNFMWRGGPVIEYRVTDDRSVGLGYERSHVSNGQGMTRRNPSYDAHGIFLRLVGSSR